MEVDNAISVSTLGNYLKQIIDAEDMLYKITVYGEVASFSISGKASYFTIKDDFAILNCVIFDRVDFAENYIGKNVVVRGTPKYYVKGGRFTFQVESISLMGEGALNKKFLELKDKLSKEGLFDLEKKKRMPTIVNKIGIVTSESGAVIQDIIDVSTRRNPNINLVLYPVKVQGVGAELEISKGIDFFSGYDVDAVIVARGGGSEEDLQPFNTELVTRSVASCNKFVVSAVGHETNFSLCDYASDLRAPTPSAAAELLVKEGKYTTKELNAIVKNILYNLENYIDDKIADCQDFIQFSQNLVANKIDLIQQKLKENCLKNNFLMSSFIDYNEHKLSLECSRISSNNPMNILSKGYVKVVRDKKILVSVKDVNINDEVDLNFADGNALAIIKEKKNEI